MECKKDIESLIENIDEFKEKYVTYRTKTLRTILVKTLDYIKRKEQECEELEQTLVEIKEICNSVENIENINSLYDAKLSGMFLQANKILQKISEVLKND